MPKFYKIVQMKDISLSIPQNSHFSIGTSPYYAHQHGLAIDIYHNLTLTNYDVVSPVAGKIIKIKKLIAPRPKFLDGVDFDYLVLISNHSNSDLVWKLMHVKPFIQLGDKIEIGDLIGETIRNGYFAYWSSPHLHLELRSFNDAIRARGGKNFSLKIENCETLAESEDKSDKTQIPIKIHSIFPEMILAYFPEHFYIKLFPIYGVKVRINHLNYILDGGIPHYKIGTVISKQKYITDNLSSVYLADHHIGTIHEKSGQFGFLKFKNVKFFLNNKEIRGLSLYLANFLPLIKIIPFEKNEFSFKPKSTQYLRIISREKLLN